MNPATISISPNIPGIGASVGGPCGWVVDFFTFSLAIAGILAFGAIVYGGVRYAASAGNPSSQETGRSWIRSALIGLLLLGGAYIILRTVNPNLTTCQLPSLSSIAIGNAAPPTGGGSTSNPSRPGTLAPIGCAGGQCQSLAHCTQTTKTIGTGAVNCTAAPGMIDTMNCIQSKDPGLQYQVTEGYPPAVKHLSAGHNNGCSIDIRMLGNNVCQDIATLQAAAVACGTSQPLNEYKSCSGKTYHTTTGNNVHINAKPGDMGC